MGVATLVNRTTSGMIALSFLTLTHVLTPALTFYLFAVLGLFATIFIAKLVPETKGRALEEIESESEFGPLRNAELRDSDCELRRMELALPVVVGGGADDPRTV